jgi:hypothetical protein
LWDDLKSEQSSKAYKALWAFVACPEQAIGYLRGRLGVVSPDRKSISRYIRDLSNNRFRIRDQAFRALKEWGDLALPDLRRRLEDKPSLEERKLIEGLLREAARWTPTRLRGLRSLQILEHIGTPNAKRLLRKLAQAAPETRLGAEAKEMLKRLGNQASKLE